MKLRIGVIGLDWDRGVPLALVLRDYGGHSVIGYDPSGTMYGRGRIDPPPHKEIRDMLDAWQLPVTDRMDIFAQYCDLVFVTSDPSRWQPLWELAVYPRRGAALPVVLTHPLSQAEVTTANLRCRPELDIGYSPTPGDRETGIRLLTVPEGPIRFAGSEHTHAKLETAWRHIVNTVPVRRYPLTSIGAVFSEGTVVGSPLAPVTLEPPPAGVDNPPPVESQEKKPT